LHRHKLFNSYGKYRRKKEALDKRIVFGDNMVDQEIEDDGKGKKDPKENDSEEPPAKAATAAGVDESVATLPELTKPESSVTTNHGQNKTNVGVATREDTIVVHSDNKEGNEENGVIADEFDQFDKNGGEDILIKTAGTDVATGGGGGIGAAGTEKEGTGENIDMVEQESGEKVIDEGKLSGTDDETAGGGKMPLLLLFQPRRSLKVSRR
jgi:hypothetical protein